jgi:hypothetical protein
MALETLHLWAMLPRQRPVAASGSSAAVSGKRRHAFGFNGQDGQAQAPYVSKTFGGFDQLFSENLNGIDMSLTGPLTRFSNVTELFFRAADNGSARVDDRMLKTAAVPLPAAGWRMLLGLGVLVAARHRKV